MKILMVLVVVFQFGVIVTAQTPTEPLVNRLEGSWEGQGKAFGMDASLQMKWEWVLGKKFIRLSLRNEMRTQNGQTQLFEGHAYYHPTGPASEARYEARWFDSRGVSFPIKAQTEGDGLVAFWGTPQQEEGKSVYRLLESGKIELVDSVKQKDGTWREFGRWIMTRR